MRTNIHIYGCTRLGSYTKYIYIVKQICTKTIKLCYLLSRSTTKLRCNITKRYIVHKYYPQAAHETALSYFRVCQVINKKLHHAAMINIRSSDII